MKTVSPQTIGDDQPCPAIGTAHFTFCVADHRSGTLTPPGATPLMSCPRNPGHVSSGFGAAKAGTADRHNATQTTELFITNLEPNPNLEPRASNLAPEPRTSSLEPRTSNERT